MGRLSADERQALIGTNLRLAYHFAGLSKYRRWGLEREDLEQEAVLGLCVAARDFDPSTHPRVAFSAFARTYVLGYIWRALARARVEAAATELPRDVAAPAADTLADDVRECLDRLPEIDRLVISARWGLEDGEPLGLIGLADRFGVSTRTATRMLQSARERLAAELRQSGWDESKAIAADEIGRKLA